MDKIRLLFTHREIDNIIEALYLALAKHEDFEIFVTDSSIQEPILKNNVSYLPLPLITSKVKPSVIKALNSYNKQYKFDIIYSVSSSGLSNAILATLFSSVKHVAYRGTGAKIRRSDPSYYLGILNPKVAHVVCETKHVQDYLLIFFPSNKLSIAVKPFDISWVDTARQEPIYIEQFKDSDLKLITVANTKGRPYKGLTTLIKAVNRLAGENISLTIVGDYEEADYRLAMEGGNAQAFHFAGVQAKALNYIAGADLYVLPSYRDASPRVVREAMALGLATIVSDIAGSRDLIVENKTGLLFPAGDDEALVQRILQLKNDERLRLSMGQAGRERIIKDFSLEDYLANFVKLFKQIK